MELDTTAWYALGIPLIALVMAVEAWLARRRGRRVFEFAETISNLSAGLGTLLLGVGIGPPLYKGWEAIAAASPLSWEPLGVWRLPLALLLADFLYYVWHRAGHRFALLWAVHGVHHQHEHLNTSVGLRLEWLGDLVAAVFFVTMPLVGCDATTGYLAIALLSLYTLTTHSEVFSRPSLGVLVTPDSHGAHHSRDARYGEGNFGAMFTLWDRLFGTYVEPLPRAELREDVPTVARGHDAVAAQWVLWGELFAQLRGKGIGAALRLLFARPVLEEGHPGPEHHATGPGRVYVVATFLATLGFSTWLLWLRAEQPLWVQVGGVIAALWALRTIGGFLDGRRGAVIEARVRWVATAIFGLALATLRPALGLGGAAVAIGGRLTVGGSEPRGEPQPAR